MARGDSRIKIPVEHLGTKLRHITLMVAIVAIYVWAIRGTESNPVTFFRGMPYVYDYVKRMFPPDMGILGGLMGPLGTTIQMAIMGVTFGAIIALPLSFLAARNVMPYWPVYQATRTFFDLCRGINEIIWALVFVSMVGLGPFPGVLALTVHNIGALGRFFSEAIEATNAELVTAVASTGANRIQTIYYGILTQVRPLFAGYTLYYLEHNFRAATVLGFVGAGGIGVELINATRLFDNPAVLTVILVMVIAVICIDRISAFIRMRLITGVVS